MKLTTEQVLDAYEAGVRASLEHHTYGKPLKPCPFAAESDEAREWRLGFEHDRTSLPTKNRRLRQLRRKAAQERGICTPSEWTALCAEFAYRCVRCGCRPARLERDHIIPIYQRGSESITNVQPLCKSCNSAKGPENHSWVNYRRLHGFDTLPWEERALTISDHKQA